MNLLYRSFRKNLLTFGVLLVSLMLTGVAWYFAQRSAQLEAAARFETEAQHVVDALRARMNAYTDALLHTRAVFQASTEVSRAEFRTYVSGMQLQERYPGLQGIGFVERVRSKELSRHLAKVRREGFPQYRIWPGTPREDYFSIVYLEPFDWRNQRAFGYDMFTESSRRSAMERARDTGLPAATSRVWLVQETEVDRQPGFLLYLPVYRKSVVQPTEVEQRRQELLGFVYSPFRVNDLFQGILATRSLNEKTGGPGTRFQVFDGEPAKGPTEVALLYDSGVEGPTNVESKPEVFAPIQGLSHQASVQVADRSWMVRVFPGPGFAQGLSGWIQFFVWVGGAIFSVLLTAVVRVTYSHYEAERDLVAREREARAGEHEALRRNQELVGELKEALRVRDEFFSIASHELKTPLTSLRLQLQLLLRTVAKDAFLQHPEASRVMGNASVSLKQAERMGKLIENLLDVARIRNHGLLIEREEVDLIAVIRDILGRFTEESRVRGSPLELTGPALLKGRWDRLRIEQVVTNLVGNALKYGAGKKVLVTVEDRGERVALSVQDHGIGIPEDDQVRIFGRFERAVAERDFNGLGLGLFIVKQIIEAHQGSIDVRSLPGFGSTFTVELPKSERAGLCA